MEDDTVSQQYPMDEGLSQDLQAIAELCDYARDMLARVEGLAVRGLEDPSYIARQHRYRCILGYRVVLQEAQNLVTEAIARYAERHSRLS